MPSSGGRILETFTLSCQGRYCRNRACFGCSQNIKLRIHHRLHLFLPEATATSRPIVTEAFMIALFRTIDLALDIYTWIIIASAIFSWLYAFNVVNSSNRFVASVGEFLYKVTEPVLRPIRNLLPNLGGIDISPIILLLIIFFIRQFMWTTLLPILL
ncbi:YGGT family protein [Brucella sp. BO2]|nr:YggT family protein [Brucella sp. NVSL 07-0026]EFM58478.1 YGGT family protein [Brucella sp. BO2]